MDSHLAPFSTNFYLFPDEHENDWEDEKDDIIQERRFEIVLMFIDDLTALSNDESFEPTLKQIYPPVLALFKQ